MGHKSKKHFSENIEPKKSKRIWLYIVVGLLVIFNILWAAFCIKFYLDDKYVDAFSLLNPARKLFSQKDMIINVQPLRDYLNNKYEVGTDANVSIYFEYLPTGANIAINKDAEFYPASLLKLPVAMAVAKRIDEGQWRWDNKLVLMASDKDDKFGSLYKEPTGSVISIEDLVKKSLAESDNTAHFILLRNLELKEVEDVYSHMGLDGFLDSSGSISAKRYSVILRSLYNSSFLSDNSSQKLIDDMTDGKFDDYIKSGLPASTVFSHKIGVDTEKKIYLDSGIVYLEGRPYILSVMTKSKTEQEAKDIMKDVSEHVYNYIKNYQE